MKKSQFENQRFIVVYDAECGVCDAFLFWISDRDTKKSFYFIGNSSPRIKDFKLDLKSVQDYLTNL